ncbi:MAG: hypothetical protein HY350_03260 [Candidatus Omnitrophica bacterium]|nr:hypothetical protein [Candidatus Omnitrophota bacterium]
MMGIIGGLIAIVVGIFLFTIVTWGTSWFVLFLKGLAAVVPAILVIGGLIAIAVGIGSVKDEMALKKKEEPKKEEEKK